MAIPAPSLSSQRLRGLKLPRALKGPTVALKRRWEGLAPRWHSPRLVIGLAGSAAFAFAITVSVAVAALAWSPIYAVLLLPCAAAWAGLMKEFAIPPFKARKQPVTPLVEAVAKKPATPRRRKTAATAASAVEAVATTTAAEATIAVEPAADAGAPPRAKTPRSSTGQPVSDTL